MNQEKEWNELLDQLFSAAFQARQATEEAKCRERREAQIEEILSANLTQGGTVMADELLFELGSAAEHEAQLFYRQGLKDCVWLLKNLGVLA